MANLESKGKMTPLQLGLAVTSTLLTARLLPATTIITMHAEQFLWLSSALAGLLFFGAAYLMIRLAGQFSEETIGEYLPRLVGAHLGAVVFSIFCLVLVLNIVNNASALTNLSAVFLFDRTPQEILVLILLMAVVYCALQDWGTILRVVQVLILSVPLLYIFYSTIWLNFNFLNLLPLWPDNFKGILKGVFYHTEYYGGYESILVLLPLASRGKLSFVRTIGWGFLLITIIYVIGGIVLIGSISAKTVASIEDPVIYAMKSVEVPGTFIERLENYMIVFFIPVTYVSMVLNYFVLAEGCRKYFKFRYHQIFIPLFLPIIFWLSNYVDTPQQQEAFLAFSMAVGLFFSFGIIPGLLFLATRKKGISGAGDTQKT